VSGEWVGPVDRAREELRAAQALLDAGFPSQALCRAYYAGLQVAVAALLVLGEAPPSEAGVISAFGRRVVGDGVEPEAGRTLRKLFEDRNDVDHALLAAPVEEAQKAIAGAEVLVESGARWVARRANGA
jgi:uncharacterized protein (UPF0332 family)